MSDVTFRRRLLPLVAALLSASGLVVLTAAPALARCPDLGGTPAQAKRASDVFTGTLGDHHRHRVHGKKLAVWTVDVDRVYKGSISDASVEVTAPPTAMSCGITGDHGDSYVFFAQHDGDRLTVARGDGTAPATKKLVAKVEDLLGDGRSATPPEPIEATFTLVAGDPADFQRVAAPGAALVIVGLLGLALASWRGRRRTG
jgi:hypothetical protein